MSYKDPEAARSYQREWNARNRAKLAAKAREYRATAIGKGASEEATAKWREANPTYALDWQRANPEKRKASRERYLAKHPTARRRGKLKARYGISLEEFASMEEAQGGLCAVCDRPPGDKPLFVDHNHTTGAVRGLLCHHCNSALGLLGDDTERITDLLHYIWFNREDR